MHSSMNYRCVVVHGKAEDTRILWYPETRNPRGPATNLRNVQGDNTPNSRGGWAPENDRYTVFTEWVITPLSRKITPVRQFIVGHLYKLQPQPITGSGAHLAESKTCDVVRSWGISSPQDAGSSPPGFDIPPFFGVHPVFFYEYFTDSGQIIATSHGLAPQGSWEREISIFQGNLGWWNIIIIIRPDRFLD